MKEFLALIIVIVVTGIIYLGVEPFAHGQMHPKVAPADYTFADLKPLEASEGNAANGKELVIANCVACHSVKSDGLESPFTAETAVAAYGVLPPDLSSAGLIYEKNFLANVIKDIAVATKQTHKFDGTHLMPPFSWMSDQEIADMIAYLQSIAPKEMTNKEVFIDACGRCHNVLYDKWQADGGITTYLDTKVPDLSMMIRSRDIEYLHNFINDPQKILPGTAMPRVGLTQEAEKQVIAYMESVGDSKKEERESLGYKLVIFMLIMGVIAYLWKRKIWKDTH
ncbi:c-type cytochrome [Helicobacter sp.]|uniref:c-type cytochrome n=1 Tax=Helicobacter sp. TaxID=218 RepID=UPI0025C3E757|nr:c-type cytochrome [Helicobacter sp.]MCI5969100.1 c-type cytochrome [Helicobacter sp.]MDY2584249.1 c-type cytochrome [Helicobacter sp.]